MGATADVREIQEKLNINLTVLTDESDRLRGLLKKQFDASTGIGEARDNIEGAKERVVELQTELMEALRDMGVE